MWFPLMKLLNVIIILKNNKAFGPEQVPNEILKTINLIFYYTNISRCFKNTCTPSVWLKSIITPIPKNAMNDPNLPLSYRGISLLSCIGKVYSSLLNNRLSKFLDKTGIMSDGFRCKRSCEDRIYSLSSIVRNRMKLNLPTFTTSSETMVPFKLTSTIVVVSSSIKKYM